MLVLMFVRLGMLFQILVILLFVIAAICAHAQHQHNENNENACEMHSCFVVVFFL